MSVALNEINTFSFFEIQKLCVLPISTRRIRPKQFTSKKPRVGIHWVFFGNKLLKTNSIQCFLEQSAATTFFGITISLFAL